MERDPFPTQASADESWGRAGTMSKPSRTLVPISTQGYGGPWGEGFAASGTLKVTTAARNKPRPTVDSSHSTSPALMTWENKTHAHF